MSKRGAKGTGRAGGGKRARPAVAPLVEDPPDPRASLEAEGYVFWRGAVPARLCEPLAAAVEAEIDEQLNAGSPCQEIPSEHLSDGTAARLREMQAWVIEHVLRPRLKPAACEVPHWWPQTLYGRLKKRHFHTSYHCDALNTVVERRLLTGGERALGQAAAGEKAAAEEEEEEEEEEEAGAGAEAEADYRHLFRLAPDGAEKEEDGEEGGGGAGATAPSSLGRRSLSSLPLFTFWVCLRDLRALSQSHLRLHARSHAAPRYEIGAGGRDGRVTHVAPAGYRYAASNFASPGTPYQLGDLVLFHCLTQHEATPHRPPPGARKKAAGGGGGGGAKGAGADGKQGHGVPAVAAADLGHRVSMDGRLRMDLWAPPAGGERRTQNAKAKA